MFFTLLSSFTSFLSTLSPKTIFFDLGGIIFVFLPFGLKPKFINILYILVIKLIACFRVKSFNLQEKVRSSEYLVYSKELSLAKFASLLSSSLQTKLDRLGLVGAP